MWIFLLSNLGMGASHTAPPAILYLPYEFTSVPIDTGNINPFDIDPEQTTVIT